MKRHDVHQGEKENIPKKKDGMELFGRFKRLPYMNKRHEFTLNKSRECALHAFDLELKFKREKMKITILHVVLFLASTLFVLFGL
jgi:hypothetical protein